MKGRMIKPERKKRMPANCNGVEYCKPILMAVKGVAQSKQANMANTVVDSRNFFIRIEKFSANLGKLNQLFCFLKSNHKKSSPKY